VDDINRCIREKFSSRILQEMNEKLASGEMSLLLGRAVVSERIAPRDMEMGEISCWRLNRTDFLADVVLNVQLVTEQEGWDVPGRFSLCLSLWFCTEERFSFEVQELHRAQDRPDRSFWKLDRHLVPILRDDEIESGADLLWENLLPEAKEPEDRSARALAEKLGLAVCEMCLHCQNRTRSILFFREGTVLTQAEVLPGGDEIPLPVTRSVAANTIVINTAAHSESRDLDILHECIHYEWHLLFYRLQKLLSTNPQEVRYQAVRNSIGRPNSDPLQYIEHQARRGSIALLLPQKQVREKAWRLFQRESTRPSVNGYLNHPGFRWDRVIRRLADEYRGVPRTTVRRRLVQLGHTAAKGAVNYIDGGYITPFAFTEEHSAHGQASLVISRRALADLYHRSGEFRQLMSRGDFVYADGHVCLNDPQFLRSTKEGARLTPWANAHVDACCLRFEKVWLKEDEESVWLFGTLNSSEDYVREYDRFLDRRMTLTARERLARRNQLMASMPAEFPDALVYLMENRDEGRVTVEELAALARISSRTVSRYRSSARVNYQPDIVVAICIALHLPPWLSRRMLGMAGFPVQSYGARGHYGEILDCCFMDTVPQVQEYLRSAGYPQLKLQEE
jgi:transcriptional regulator with XRE-family HTH domain